MESAYFYNVFFASSVATVADDQVEDLITTDDVSVPSVDTLIACERLPTDVLTMIGQFIDVKTMEEQIRFIQLAEKFERFKSRTDQEWIDIAVQFPEHFDMFNVKVYPTIVEFVFKTQEIRYKKPKFVNYCSLTAKDKYTSLYINLINRNLSRFNCKYQGQQHTMLNGKNAKAIPDVFWDNRNYGKQGCSPLYWAWFIETI
jgi:hypothetical protein